MPRIKGISIVEYDKLRPEALAQKDGKDYWQLSEEEKVRYDQLSKEQRKQYEEPIPEEELEDLYKRVEELKKYEPHRLSWSEDVNWIVPGVLVSKGVSCLVGESEAGKTTLSLQLSKCLIRGEQFLSLPTKPLERILWIELDESLPMLKEQADKIQPHLSDQLYVWDEVAWYTNTGIIANLVKVVLNCNPQLIVIDALNSIGIDENNNSEIARLYKHLRTISQHFELSILLLHHLRKRLPRDDSTLKQRVRGAGDIVNKADCVLGLERDGYAATLSTLKLRAKNRLELSLRQDPNTLLFSEVMKKSDHIEALLLQGKSRAETIEIIYQQDGGNKASIGKAVDRKGKELEAKGKLLPNLPTRGFK